MRTSIRPDQGRVNGQAVTWRSPPGSMGPHLGQEVVQRDRVSTRRKPAAGGEHECGGEKLGVAVAALVADEEVRPALAPLRQVAV